MGEKDTFSWQDLSRSFWQFLEGERLSFIILNIINMIGHANVIIMPFVVGLIIDFFTTYTPGSSLSLFYIYCAILAASTAILSIIRLYAKRRLSETGIEIRHKAKVEGFSRLMAFSIKWHDNESTGNKVERINKGGDGLQRIVNLTKDQISSIIITFIGALAVFAAINYRFLIFFAIYLTLFFIVTRYYDKKLVGLTKERDKAQEKATGTYFEGANNILSVKSLGASKSLSNVIEQSESEYKNQSKKILHNKNSRLRTVQIIYGLGLGAYFLLVGNGVVTGTLTVGFIATAFSYFGSVTGGMLRLTGIIPELIEQRSAVSRLMPIFNTKEDKYFGNDSFPKNWKQIQFKNASFSHGTKETLKDLHITIRKNEKVGVIGASGSGKSTFGQLLTGIHQIKKGTVHIGNKSFYDINHEEILEEITPVIQETELFNMSLKDNIQLFKTVNKKTFEKAIEISQLQPIINNLPKGLETLIGEKGYKLSGGERQRVGIARAICKDPSILILDEATSALDSKTELQIQSGIEQLAKKTIIIIAHRLSTLENVDRIIVFEKGKIIEQGTFKELLKNKNTHFHKLWNRQNKKRK